MSAPRVLVVSHAHPDQSLGGGEIAAWGQWAELRRRGIEAMLLARSASRSGHTGTPFSARSSDGREMLFHAPPVDHFKHSQPHRRLVYEDFRDLLIRFHPTVVHFHHYVHLGLELIREVRRYSNDIPIVLTLHDYLGMCHAQGQMVKTNGMLCRRAVPLDCHTCFPERSPQDFFMRELFVKSFFGLVDRFISPSAFLRDRYVGWGLPADRFTVLENGQPAPVADGAELPDLRDRFVVLGQLSRLKGSPVAIDAVRALSKTARKRVRIEIHGTVQHAEESFRQAFHQGIAELGPTLRYCGPYLPGDVGAIVRSAGWVIVPSIWWENSPMVIQEAFSAGRPVICSNIGGMAEKVADGVNGLHFRVGSAADLATRIEEAATTPGLWERLRAGIVAPPTIDGTVDRLLDLYRLGRAPTGDAAREAVRQTS